MALSCPLCLRAQGAKEKRGNHPLHFWRVFAVALLFLSSPRCTLAVGTGVCLRTPWEDAVSRCLYPLLHPIREEQLCNFKVLFSGLQFFDWGTAKAKKCRKGLTEQNLAKRQSQHALLKSRKIVTCWRHNNNLQSYVSL